MAIYEVYKESCKAGATGKIELREEQVKAVKDALAVFKKPFTEKKPYHKFLWNAKMRFGKTLCAMQLAKEMGVKRTLIVTHRPVVDKGWREDFDKIFEKDPKYKYATRFDDEGIGNIDELESFAKKGNHYVLFVSMQYLVRSEMVSEKGNDDPLKKKILLNEWDLVVADEAHEGMLSLLGSRVIEYLKKPKTCMLHLSGTPFNLYEDFATEEIFTWDYIQEQTAKREWATKHPLLKDQNPYAELPQMKIFTYNLGNLVKGEGLIKENAGFQFAEFFRTWTGNSKIDGKRVAKELEGKFVHEKSVKEFLDLLCKEDAENNYPFSTVEYQEKFKHTLWVVPGVKAAKALKELLDAHETFGDGAFDIVNVAGNTDDDEQDDNALDRVLNAIGKDPEQTNTITISCGRLTTGTTVRPWTAVFYMKGSESTNAATYMQTIFRVQTPYHTKDGRMKAECYVFDFAPDRSLKSLAETARFISKTSKDKLKSSAVANKRELDTMKKLLEFCPVIAYDGGQMRSYNEHELFVKLAEAKIDRVVQRGFDDNALYNIEELLKMDPRAVNKLLDKLGKTPGMKEATKIDLAAAGLGAKPGKGDKPGDGDDGTDEEDDEETKAAKAAAKEARKERDNRIAILRGVSLRIPLLMFGAEVKNEDRDVTVDNFASFIDDASWTEFMPRDFTKKDFGEIKSCYDAVVFADSWKRYRQLAREADEYSIEDRIKMITTIFGYFHNPDKETVLTPWRVVNMHMSDTIGGYCFFNEKFDGPNLKWVEHGGDGRARTPSAPQLVETNEPRWVNQPNVTKAIFQQSDENGDTPVKILEINSKTGLYPLYVTYSLYRSILPTWQEVKGEDGVLLLAEEQALWDKILQENIFVICNTPMAARITERTLRGFRKVEGMHIKDIKLVEEATKDQAKLVKKLNSKAFWSVKGEGEMKFNAIVGNPPYQMVTAKKELERNGQPTRKNIFHMFQVLADALGPRFVSMIYPGGRWMHRSGKGMEEFGLAQINDKKLAKVLFYPNSDDIFDSVAIADGISIVFKDAQKTTSKFQYVYQEHGKEQTLMVEAPGDKLMPLNPRNDVVIGKVENFVANNKLAFMCERVLPRSLFGIESEFVELNPKKVKLLVDGYKLDSAKEVKLYTNDKAGKAGRSQWYVANRSVIAKDKQGYIDQWKVVVSSANAGGQKRDSQLAIIDNHSAFGRSRVALGSFKTKAEAENFYKFCRTVLVRFMFLMTDEALTSLGKKVPDLMDYTSKNKLVDFSGDLDKQLNKLVGLTPDEVAYMKGMVRPLAD